MSRHPRPIVVVSQCLEFEACRYDGARVEDAFVRRLREVARCLPLCPELGIGLGVPRAPVRLVADRATGQTRLVQPSTGTDLTAAMTAFTQRALDGLSEVDGFLLKSRSPSCGLRDAKLYGAADAERHRARGAGAFARDVQQRFGQLALEDEARLGDPRTRAHFALKLFALAGLREAEQRGAMAALVAYHARHKLLLMSHHQERLRELGRIVANAAQHPAPAVFAAYRQALTPVLRAPARVPSVANALQHAFGYVSARLTPGERRSFLGQLDRYQAGKLPLGPVREVLWQWVQRFEERYLLEQAFFEPYPSVLDQVGD